MATTVTPRLGLKKQEAGDNPGGWEVDLNAGFDDADTRFFQSGAGDPNTATQAHYISQRYLDTDTDLWWTAQDTAGPSTWVSDAVLIHATDPHPANPTTLAADYTHGDIRAVLEPIDDDSVQLRPLGPADEIYVDIDGTRLTITGDFVFDLSNAAHREGAQTRDVSTRYYLYIDNSTVPGTPAPILSKTAPDDVGGDEAGYHPTDSAWRCVGSVWNNSSDKIQPFVCERDGKIRFTSPYDRTDHHHVLTEEQSAVWISQALNIPLTAEAVELQFYAEGSTQSDGSYVVIGLSDASTTGWPDTAAPHSFALAAFADVHAMLNMDTNAMIQDIMELPIMDRAAPAFKYAVPREGTLRFLEVVVSGYRDLWAPRGF
jgi:hypothetical protein